MSKITLNNVADLTQPITAAAVINANSATIQNSFDNTLSRDGTSPNTMNASLDMNSNRILNLPAAVLDNDPVRLIDIVNMGGNPTVAGIPVGGTTNQVLTKDSNTDFDVSWSTPLAGTVSSVALTMPADFSITGSPVTSSGTLGVTYVNTPTGTGGLVRSTSPTLTTPTINNGTLSTPTVTNPTVSTGTFTSPTVAGTGITMNGSTSGSTILRPSAVASGTITLPATTDTVCVVAGGQTLTNKVISGSSNTISNVALSNLSSQAANTLVGNFTSGSATPTASTIGALTQKVAPAGTDLVLIQDQAASGALKYATVSSVSSAGSVSSIAGNTGAFTLSHGLVNSTNDLRIDIPSIANYIGGLTLSTAGGSATFGIAAGSCSDSTNADFMKLSSAYTKTSSTWLVGSGSGALDTGTATASTWYHVHIIKRTDTNVVDVLISLSATAPTMPTNYTLRRRIGSIFLNSSSQWTAFTQRGQEFWWVTPTNDITASGSFGSTSANFTIASPLGISVQAIMNFQFNAASGAPAACYFRNPSDGDIVPGSFNGPSLRDGSSSAQGVAGQHRIWTNTSSQIAGRASASSCSLFGSVLGWYDPQGQF